MATSDTDEWQLWWDARLLALEAVFGEADPMVGHALVPLFLGADAGGAADLLYFRNHVLGVVAVTADLIGFDEQPANSQGAYELMICHRNDDAVGPALISRIATNTIDAVLEPGQTMDIAPVAPTGSTIAALLFLDYARLTVRQRSCGVLLCIGITADELQQCRSGNGPRVEAKLKSGGVYPFTDWNRKSVFSSKK